MTTKPDCFPDHIDCEHRAYIGKLCTLRGEPATITNECGWAKIRPLDPQLGDGCQYSWYAVFAIMDEQDGEFERITKPPEISPEHPSVKAVIDASVAVYARLFRFEADRQLATGSKSVILTAELSALQSALAEFLGGYDTACRLLTRAVGAMNADASTERPNQITDANMDAYRSMRERVEHHEENIRHNKE